MKDRLMIIPVWVVVGWFFYLSGHLALLLKLILLFGCYEICVRTPWSLWTVAALFQIISLRCLLSFPIIDVYFIVSVVIATDTMSLIGGKYLNCNDYMEAHIFPMSPNKTRGGLIYGLVSAIFVSFLLIIWLKLSLWYLVFGLMVSGLAVCGDLLESAFKRFYKIKDSADGLIIQPLINGHGGFYDRFDALAMAALGWDVGLRLLQ